MNLSSTLRFGEMNVDDLFNQLSICIYVCGGDRVMKLIIFLCIQSRTHFSLQRTITVCYSNLSMLVINFQLIMFDDDDDNDDVDDDDD